MNLLLAQKHLSYIIIAIGFIYLISCQKEASRPTSEKIIYTDIIPDTTIANFSTSTLYHLDLDNDGTYDFTFYCAVYSAQCRPEGGSGYKTLIGVSPAENSFNEISNVVYYNLDSVPAALDTLTEIGSAVGDWSPAYGQYIKYRNSCCCSHGDYWFDEAIDKYMGLKLVKGSQVFYGWVRLNVLPANLTTLTIRDYAYNSTSNGSIHAGQKE